MAAWKASKHANVTCVQCHYPPGFRDTLWVKYQALSQVVKWATHTYSSKPFAEVEDGSCLRSGCHDRAQLAARKVFERGVAFDHTSHLAEGRRGPRLRCTSCASGDVEYLHTRDDRGAQAEACRACRGYLKLFDQERRLGAEPAADDAATIALDLLVADEGYRRAGPNLYSI